jgi:hypothetical protein
MSSGLNLNSIMDIAEIAVGCMTGQPEIAAMGLEDMMKNVASQAFGQALGGLNLPAPLKDAMQTAFDGALGNYQQMSQDAMKTLQDLGNNQGSNGGYSGNMDQGVNSFISFVQQLVQQLMQQLQDQANQNTNGGQGGGSNGGAAGGAGAGGAPGSAGGAPGATGGSDPLSDPAAGDDFFIILAKALGKAAQSEADKVQNLSKQLSQATSQANGQDPSSTGGKDAQNKIMELSTQVQAESQRMSYIMQGIHTALESIGQAIQTAAKNQ